MLHYTALTLMLMATCLCKTQACLVKFLVLQFRNVSTFASVLHVLLLKHEVEALHGSRVELESEDDLPFWGDLALVVAFHLRGKQEDVPSFCSPCFYTLLHFPKDWQTNIFSHTTGTFHQAVWILGLWILPWCLLSAAVQAPDWYISCLCVLDQCDCVSEG